MIASELHGSFGLLARSLIDCARYTRRTRRRNYSPHGREDPRELRDRRISGGEPSLGGRPARSDEPAPVGSGGRHRGASAHEVPNDSVELLRVLHEHEVVPALALLEDLQPGPADLVRDPDLRLPGHE